MIVGVWNRFPYHPIIPRPIGLNALTETWKEWCRHTNYVGDDHRTWDIHMAEFAFAMNSVTHATTGMAPSVLMTGRHLRAPLTNRLNIDNISDPPDDPASLMQKVAEQTDTARMKCKEYYDKKRRMYTLNIGDTVMVKMHPQSNAKKHFAAKLAPRWCSPFTVKKRLTPVNYKLVTTNDAKKEIVVHIDQTKSCGTWMRTVGRKGKKRTCTCMYIKYNYYWAASAELPCYYSSWSGYYPQKKKHVTFCCDQTD